MAGPEGLAHLQDPPVVGVAGKLCGEGDVHAVGLHPQPAAVGQGHAGEEIALGPEGLQPADGLAGVGALLALGAFQGVQLLQDHDGEDDLVVLKGL